jgi:spore maturation protein CgeB
LISLPYAANPLKHYMRPGRCLWDYFFVGTNSPAKKREIENHLMPIIKNYRGIVAGAKWPQGLTELNSADVPLFYNFARICPNFHTTRQIEEYNEVNARTFMIPACGGFQLVDNPMAMKECFDEDEMCVAFSPREYQEKFEYYLENEEERIEYIRKGMRRVFNEHTLFHVLTRLAEFIQQMPVQSQNANVMPEIVSARPDH